MAIALLWTSAKSPSSGKSMHLMCAFAKAAPALSTSSEIILFRFALLDNNQQLCWCEIDRIVVSVVVDYLLNW